MKRIKLTQEKYAIVDDEDFERINALKWCYNIKVKNTDWGYAQRQHLKDGKWKTLYMHKEILKVYDKEIDHINGNRLDNRKENLKVTTHAINMRNLGKRKNVSSNYIGVHFNKSNNNWRAQIKIDNKTKCLGSYKTEKKAYEARQNYIIKNQLEGFRR